MKTLLVLIITFFAYSVFAQYAPELDVRGTDDTADGGELQLATPTGTNFLRFFSGRLGDPSPHLYFSNQDTFHIATGSPNFSNFSKRLTILPNGFIGMNTSDPKSLLHVNGDFTTPWNVTFRHFQDGWTDNYQTYLNKSWNGDLWDYLYLGATGNRDNSEQAAMILSHQKGIVFGKGHNDGNKLSEEHVQIDSAGKVKVSTLSGNSKRAVFTLPDGTLIAECDTSFIAISATAFHPTGQMHLARWTSNYGETYYDTNTVNHLVAPISLPHNAKVIKTAVYFTDDNKDTDAMFWLGYRDTNVVVQNIGQSSNGANFVITEIPNGIVIDNENKAYFLSMSPEAGGELNADLKIHQIQISYVH